MDLVGYIGIIATIIGAVSTLYGLLSKRDAKIANDSEWKGTVNTKLDMILGIKENVSKLEAQVNNHESRISVLEDRKKVV